MSCFVDLVRTLLGESAVADDKCECGHSLVVLGVEVLMADNGYAFRPAKEGSSSAAAGATTARSALARSCAATRASFALR